MTEKNLDFTIRGVDPDARKVLLRFKQHPAQQWPVECPVCSALVPQTAEATAKHNAWHAEVDSMDNSNWG